MAKLFSGTCHPKLTEEVAKHLGVSVSKSEVVRFDNSEVRVRVEDDVKNETCVIIQPTSNPTDTNLMELFFFCDALKRQEARSVVGIIPYFGYSRQDIQHREGECVSANVIIRFLQSIGFHKIYTFDLHDEATGGVFHIPFKNLTALPLLAEHVRRYLKGNVSPEDVVVVSPDQGGVERARGFGMHLFGSDEFHIAVTEKKRDIERVHMSKAVEMYGDVKGKVAVFVDDVVTSGGSIVHAAQLCKQQGARKIISVFTHHDFSENAPDRFMNSPIDICFSTNTIPLLEEVLLPKLEEISIAPSLSEEISYLFT